MGCGGGGGLGRGGQDSHDRRGKSAWVGPRVKKFTGGRGEKHSEHFGGENTPHNWGGGVVVVDAPQSRKGGVRGRETRPENTCVLTHSTATRSEKNV